MSFFIKNDITKNKSAGNTLNTIINIHTAIIDVKKLPFTYIAKHKIKVRNTNNIINLIKIERTIFKFALQ